MGAKSIVVDFMNLGNIQTELISEFSGTIGVVSRGSGWIIVEQGSAKATAITALLRAKWERGGKQGDLAMASYRRRILLCCFWWCSSNSKITLEEPDVKSSPVQPVMYNASSRPPISRRIPYNTPRPAPNRG